MLSGKQSTVAELSATYQDLKERVHQRVIELLDLPAVSVMSQDTLAPQLTKVIEQTLQQESVPLNLRERAHLTQEILWEVLGLGPLEPLLADPTGGHPREHIQTSVCRTVWTAGADPDSISG